jgi:cell division protein FtsB
VLVFIMIAVTIDAVVGDRGVMAMMRARDQYAAAASALERQKAENARLRDQVDRLKSDPAAIE